LAHTKTGMANKSKKDQIKYCEAINARYSYYLETPISISNLTPQFVYDDRFPNTKELVKGSRIPSISESLYDSYVFYSKFEHVGFDSYRFYSRILSEETRTSEVLQLSKLLIDFVTLNKSFLVYFKSNNQKAIDEINNVSDMLIEEIKKI
jgi:hypothetical protein